MKKSFIKSRLQMPILSLSSTENTKFVRKISYLCHLNQTLRRVILPDCAACSLSKIPFVRMQVIHKRPPSTPRGKRPKLHLEVFPPQHSTLKKTTSCGNQVVTQIAMYLIKHQEERSMRHAGGGLLREAFRQPRPVNWGSDLLILGLGRNTEERSSRARLPRPPCRPILELSFPVEHPASPP